MQEYVSETTNGNARAIDSESDDSEMEPFVEFATKLLAIPKDEADEVHRGHQR